MGRLFTRAFLRRAAVTLLLSVLTAATAQAENTLVSHIECYGSERVVYIGGWVYDSYTTTKWWQLGENIELKAIVSNTPNEEDDGYEPMREGPVEYFARDDVNTTYGLSGKHNFRMSVEIILNIEPGEDPSRTLYVKVYATVNNGNGYEDFLLNSPYTEVTMYETGQEPATEVSEIWVHLDGNNYDLFTGFIATSGSSDGYPSLVDGNQSNGWYVSQGNMSVDFHSDKMIVPKGFILNYNNPSLNTNKIELLAKKDIGDDWTVIYLNESQSSFSFSDKTLTKVGKNYGNNPYKFFRFSVDLDASVLKELRLFGYSTQSHAVSIPSRLGPYIEANKVSAYTGETVRLTLDEKIDESTLTVSDGTNNLPLTDASFRQYTFTMPAANATVSAKYQTFALLDDDSAQPVGKKNTDIIASKKGAANVMLQDRILYRDGDWNTLCLPFPLTTFRDTPLEGFTVMELDGTASHLDGSTLYLNFTPATSIEAGKPYIVKSNSTGVFRLTGASRNVRNADRMMDSNFNSACLEEIKSGAAYIDFQALEPVHATNYAMTTFVIYNHEQGYQLDSRPTKWRLLAKLNEGDTWNEIDSRNSNENPEDALPDGPSKSFALQHPGDYQYFRLEVSNSTDGDYAVIAELEVGCDWLTNITSPVFEWVNVSADAPTPVVSSDGAVTFVGSYSPVSLAANDRSVLYLGAGNTLYWPSAAMNIGSCRALFRLGSGAQGNVRACSLSFGDGSSEQTGIKEIENGRFLDEPSGEAERKIENEAGAWYDLQGRRMDSSIFNSQSSIKKKGLYIHGGRKVVVK